MLGRFNKTSNSPFYAEMKKYLSEIYGGKIHDDCNSILNPMEEKLQ